MLAAWHGVTTGEGIASARTLPYRGQRLGGAAKTRVVGP
jgi:hypothetical protein